MPNKLVANRQTEKHTDRDTDRHTNIRVILLNSATAELRNVIIIGHAIAICVPATDMPF